MSPTTLPTIQTSFGEGILLKNFRSFVERERQIQVCASIITCTCTFEYAVWQVSPTCHLILNFLFSFLCCCVEVIIQQQQQQKQQQQQQLSTNSTCHTSRSQTFHSLCLLSFHRCSCTLSHLYVSTLLWSNLPSDLHSPCISFPVFRYFLTKFFGHGAL